LRVRMPAPTPTPTATPRPGEPPVPTPEPTATPTPTPTPAPAPAPAPTLSLLVAIFQDDNADALRQPGEPGLVLRVQVESREGWEDLRWSMIFTADATGLVTITLPGPGTYTISLADRPGPLWKTTTRTSVEIRVEEDGSVVLLSWTGQDLPVGLAEGVALAFGLTPPPVLWPFILLFAGIVVWMGRKLSYVRLAESIRQYATTEKQIYQILEEEE